MAYNKNAYANLAWVKFLGKPFLFLLLGFGIVAGFKFWKWRKSRPIDVDAQASKINPSTELQKIARELAHHLGTGYFWLNWRSWTENDKEAFELIKDLDRSQFDQVAKLYNQIFASGNDLRADLNRLLDQEYKKQLTIL